jgi:hypothetical protein
MRPVVSSRVVAAAISMLACVVGDSYLHGAAAFQMRSYATGKQLFQVCSEDQNSCYMYVYGVLDMIMLTDDSKQTCTFNADGVAGDKAVNTVLTYLTAHQDRMDWSAAALVQNAIRSKFPCPKKKPADKPAPDTPKPDAAQ